MAAPEEKPPEYAKPPPYEPSVPPPAYQNVPSAGYYGPPPAGLRTPFTAQPYAFGCYQTIPPPGQPPVSVVVLGGCPACGVGTLEEEFTCLGLLLAVCFFPVGLLCCLALRVQRCTSCGAVFG